MFVEDAEGDIGYTAALKEIMNMPLMQIKKNEAKHQLKPTILSLHADPLNTLRHKYEKQQ